MLIMAEHLGHGTSRAAAQKKLTSSVKILRYLYRDVDGREVSLQHRKAMKTMESENTNDAHLTYGEVNAQSFLQILALVDNLRKSDSTTSSSKVFVDLGCGTGLAVLCAALSPYEYTKVYGIELVPSLTSEAVKCQQRLVELINQPSVLQKPDTTVSKSASKKNNAVDETTLPTTALGILNKHLTSINSPSMTVEAFANLLCKELGHKVYKALVIKSHKTFIKFLQSHAQHFDLSDNNTVVQPSSTGANTSVDSTEPVDIDVSESSNDINGPGSSSSCSSSSSGSVKLDSSDVIPYINSLPEIVFETNDIFQVDWFSDADVVYAASLLFSEEMMVQLNERVHRMKRGSYFINLRELPLSSKLVLVSESFFKMSWQMAKVYIYRIT